MSNDTLNDFIELYAKLCATRHNLSYERMEEIEAARDEVVELQEDVQRLCQDMRAAIEADREDAQRNSGIECGDNHDYETGITSKL